MKNINSSNYLYKIIFGIVMVFLLYFGVKYGIDTIKVSKAAEKNKPVVEIQNNTPYNVSVADMIEKVSPGVVTVSVNSVVESYKGINEISGIGSGFFISPTRILTNHHVLLSASNAKIILNDGTELEAKVVNSDQVNDIALLEVTTPNFKSNTVLKMGSSDDVRVGDWVVAIGSPLDLSFSGTATAGIISGVSRTIETKQGMSTFIQTDAAINPGNSGGPLLNLKGEVIGINTAKLDVDGVESIGFAIPISLAKMKLEELSKHVITLGISGVDINDMFSRETGVSRGVFVVEVEANSVAHNIGIIPGDILISFNGVKINSVNQINELKKSIDREISVTVMRNKKIVNLNLRINE